MNISITTSRDVLTILGGRRMRAHARPANDTHDDDVMHCTEKAWRSSWHERMEQEERAFEDCAFGVGERDAG